MRASPFTKEKSEHSDVHFLQKHTKKINSKVHETINDLFPSAAQVPHSIRFCMSIFYITAILVSFVALIITGYQSTLKTQFLSPYDGSGTASKNCELIPTTVTGKFLCTQTGHWEGDNLFSYSDATYEASIVGLAISRDEYYAYLDQFYTGLVGYGGLASTQELGANLLLWMSLVFVNATMSAQRFSLIGIKTYFLP